MIGSDRHLPLAEECSELVAEANKLLAEIEAIQTGVKGVWQLRSITPKLEQIRSKAADLRLPTETILANQLLYVDQVCDV